MYALQTSATDYDLTGQIIWKAADILSKYIIDHCEDTFKGTRILELGSGPGLCGLIAAHYAKQVILSDYQDLVMDLIKMNIKDFDPKKCECSLNAVKLDWKECMKDNYYDSIEILDCDSKA